MKHKILTFAALVLAFSPTLALAHSVPTPGVHSHTAQVHDRSPRLHERGPVAHH